jgi:hypothetical protein
MEEIIRYRCENCNEVHELKSEIFHCVECGIEMCVYCSVGNGLCADNCGE